ncbi:unnamed protein product, partial [marine sediment metagenome]
MARDECVGDRYPPGLPGGTLLHERHDREPAELLAVMMDWPEPPEELLIVDARRLYVSVDLRPASGEQLTVDARRLHAVDVELRRLAECSPTVHDARRCELIVESLNVMIDQGLQVCGRARSPRPTNARERLAEGRVPLSSRLPASRSQIRWRLADSHRGSKTHPPWQHVDNVAKSIVIAPGVHRTDVDDAEHGKHRHADE